MWVWHVPDLSFHIQLPDSMALRRPCMMEDCKRENERWHLIHSNVLLYGSSLLAAIKEVNLL